MANTKKKPDVAPAEAADADIKAGKATPAERRPRPRKHEGPETEFVTRVQETEDPGTADKPWDELTQEQKQARADLYRSLEPTPPSEPDRPTRKPWAVYSGEKVDTVHASKIIFQNPKARNSLSVMQMQRALNEAGYHETLRDRGGYFSDGTLEALEAFKADKNLTDADLFEVLSTLFSGDPNVALTR